MKQLTITVVLVACLYSVIKPQSVGVAYGISGTQNFGIPLSTIDFSFLLNLSEKFSATVTFANWSGEDGNYSYFKANSFYPNANSFYGNQSFNLLIFYNFGSHNKFQFSVGTGFGQYKMLHRYYGYEDYNFESAIVLAPLFITYSLTNNIALFTRGILGFETASLNPNWGSLVIGIFVNPISMFK